MRHASIYSGMNTPLVYRMGKIFKFLGLTVGIHTEDDVAQGRQHFLCDVTYTTAQQLCFTYLRDQTAANKDMVVSNSNAGQPAHCPCMWGCFGSPLKTSVRMVNGGLQNHSFTMILLHCLSGRHGCAAVLCVPVSRHAESESSVLNNSSAGQLEHARLA